MRFAAALFLALAAGPAAAQDPEALARGQKYLDKVAAAWAGKLPQERLVGVYLGRKWVGTLWMRVGAAPKESGAVFELTLKGEIAFMGHSMKAENRSLLAKDLSPVSDEDVKVEDGKTRKLTVTVEKGRWKLRREEKDEVKQDEGTVVPGTTLEANVLPFFVLPDDAEFTLAAPDSKEGPFQFRKRADKKALYMDGKKTDLALLEMSNPGKPPALWYLSPGGEVVEFAVADAPVRCRPVTEAQRGQPLDEPLELKPAERALVDMFLALKKNDKAAVLAAFDFERMARESSPGYAELPEGDKKEIIDVIEDDVMTGLLSEGMRNQLPDVDFLEDLLAGAMKTTEKEGLVSIETFGKTVWRMYCPAEGDRKGRWLICGAGSK